MNQERAYTLDKRAYDKSMLGILALSSPPTGAVGIVRQLAMDANIIGPRGYLKIEDNVDNLKAKNLFSPAESLVTGSVQHDDANRNAMTTSQSKHIVPVKKYDTLLVGNGVDKVMGNMLSNDFCFTAKEDGKIIEINNDTKIVILQYKNGDTDIIDLNVRISKNGG